MISLLQAYRGIAAILVVLFHAKMTTENYFGNYSLLSFFDMGEAGVQFFFVLSGFIIFYIHNKDLGISKRVYPYLKKRIIRIYPIYIIITLLFTPFWLLIPDFGNTHHKEILPLIKSLFLFPQEHPPHLGVAWTLTHEIFFYLVFSIAIINKKIGKTLLFLWFLFIVLFNFSGASLSFPFNFLLSVNNLLFGMGIITAMYVIRYKHIPSNSFIFVLSNLTFIAVALGAASFHQKIGRTIDVIFIILLGISAVSIILQAKAPYLESFFRKKPILLLLGDASYSIYLIHFPILSAMSKLLHYTIGEATHPIVPFIILVIIATVCGILFHLLIEKPIITFLSKRIRYKRG
jgi:peptidoglycan/LPS O-acetylase OafA/YrhL